MTSPDKEPSGPTTVAGRYAVDGAEYFSYQVRAAQAENRIAVTRFAPYVKPTDNVADFGCGTGWLLKMLEAGDKVGIEPSPDARAHAQTIGIRAVPSATELSDGWADVVISNHALEHSLSPYDELVKLRRILRPGGKLVFGLPVDDWRNKVQRAPDPDEPNHHLFTWTPLLISNLLTEAGYVVHEARVFTYLQPYYNEWLFPRLPRPVFDVLAKLFGRLMRYHQIMVVAERPLADAPAG